MLTTQTVKFGIRSCLQILGGFLSFSQDTFRAPGPMVLKELTRTKLNHNWRVQNPSEKCIDTTCDIVKACFVGQWSIYELVSVLYNC